MRRSVLLRFLGLSLAVALGAVIATAVIATYSTSEKLQGEIAENASQLQTDGEIYSRLNEYAGDHPTWSGVDKLVNQLAGQTGRRIALTEADGTVLADSARMLGAGPELPSMPAATIDARNEGNALFTKAAAAMTTRMEAGKAGARVMMSAPYLLSPSWGLTDQERRDRDRLANQAVACYQSKGTTATVSSGGGDGPQVIVESGRTVDGMTVKELVKAGAPVDDECLPAGLNAPSAKALMINQDEVRRAVACLK